MFHRECFFVFFKLLEDTCPFCGATDTPVLDFWWRLPWVSKPRWTRLHAFLPACYSSDSPLVQHLLTSWQPAWQPSHFDPRTCSRQTYPQALVASRSEPWLEPMAWAGARTHDLPCRNTAWMLMLTSTVKVANYCLKKSCWQEFFCTFFRSLFRCYMCYKKWTK